MQYVLGIVQGWEKKFGLRVNPAKMKLVLFTGNQLLLLGEKRLNLVKEIEYSDVIIDHKLTWSSRY